jgi:hypothetical protein
MSAPVALLAAARRGLTEAMLADTSAERYARAHLAAIRAAAAVLAVRARPTGRRSRPRSVWVLLPAVAPELREWAEFFAAGAAKRSLVQAGVSAVTAREADDLLRDAEAFCFQVSHILPICGQATLPATG